MSVAAPERRGRPIVFLALVMLGWIGLRVATFEAPWPAIPEMQRVSAIKRLAQVEDPPALPFSADLRAGARFPLREGERVFLRPLKRRLALATDRTEPTRNAGGDRFESGRMAAEHSLLRSAPMVQVSRPRSGDTSFDLAVPAQQSSLAARGAPSRWRIDGWLLVRSGAMSGVTGGQQVPGYGASQVGAVLNYRLAPAAPRAPSVYLRASHALIDGGESEAALGLSARPIPNLPITAHAELRATRRPGGIELRPAGFVAGGFERGGLPLALRVRGYAAGGYVGGDFATVFVDGQAVADAEVARFDLGALRAGAGAWGGAQRGAARLDVGPTASLEVRLGEVRARLSLDYRYRVTGDAEPASGAALTLSTGF